MVAQHNIHRFMTHFFQAGDVIIPQVFRVISCNGFPAERIDTDAAVQTGQMGFLAFRNSMK